MIDEQQATTPSAQIDVFAPAADADGAPPTALDQLSPEHREQIRQALQAERVRRAQLVDDHLAGVPESERPRTDSERDGLEWRQVMASVRVLPYSFMFASGRGRAPSWQPKAWTAWRVDHAALLAARAVLLAARNATPPDELASRPMAEERLEQAIKERLEEACAAVLLPEGQPGGEEVDGMYELDARLARYIDTLGAEAHELADGYRRKWRMDLPQQPPCEPGSPKLAPKGDDSRLVRDRWADCLRLPRVLGNVLWQTVVRPQLEAECRAPTPAIAVSVATELVAACFSPGRKFELCDGKGKALDADGTVLLEADVPSMDPDHFEALQRGAELFKGLTGQRLLFYVPRQLHLQKGTPNDGTILVPGGYKGLAEAIGEHSRKAPEKLVDLLRAGWLWHRTWPGGEVCGLWTFGWQRRASPKQHAILWLTPAPFFSPYYAIKRLDRDRHFSWPVLAEPSFIGRRLDHAAQNAFLFLLGGAFVEHRVELVQEGGARLPPAELAALAARVGLPPKLVPEVLERWTDTDGPLELVGVDRYILRDTERYRAARKWLLGAGELTLKNRARRRRARSR